VTSKKQQNHHHNHPTIIIIKQHRITELYCMCVCNQCGYHFDAITGNEEPERKKERKADVKGEETTTHIGNAWKAIPRKYKKTDIK
jgi:hypothetical protein